MVLGHCPDIGLLREAFFIVAVVDNHRTGHPKLP